MTMPVTVATTTGWTASPDIYDARCTRFMVLYSAPNFNASAVTCLVPPFMVDTSVRHTIISRVGMIVSAAAAGITFGTPKLMGKLYSITGRTYALLSSFVTAAAYETHDWGEIGVMLPQANITDTTPLLMLEDISGQGALDDLTIAIVGDMFIEPAPVAPGSGIAYPTPAPVTLDGIRWPLRRSV